jgi:hypothetical protein
VRCALLGLGSGCLAILVWNLGASFLRSIDAERVASTPSPDSSMVAEHCRSLTDTNLGHHAPYGDQVYLRTSQRPGLPCTGTVIFAGYCRELAITWASDEKIALSCPEMERLLTLTARAHGIAISLDRSASSRDGAGR